MASVNKVIILGNLGANPETRTFPSGGQITIVSIATTERWRDRNTGENRELTEWHRVVFHDRQAEIAAQYLRKGSAVYVEGSLRTRKWTDQNNQERFSTEIRANHMQLLGGRTGNAPGPQQAGYGAADDAAYDDSYDAAPAPRRATPPAARPSSPAPAPAPTPIATPSSSGFDGMDDDIPF